MTYSDKLKDPRWQKMRLKILDRDNFQCQHCGNKSKELHVHHLQYLKFKDPWQYENEMLMTLCKDCHFKEEKLIEELNFYIRNITISCQTVSPVLTLIKEDFKY